MIGARRYYVDAYTTRFQATITERVHENGRTAVLLNQTYFYPASGGQPADQGQIGGASVTDVTIREQDEAILHWLGKGEIWRDEVTAEINWDRRFDHMQQHTGQHILSQAFLKTAEAETVSFHLSDNSVTIDLHTHQLQPQHVEQAELLANQIIWQNRSLHIRFVSPAEAKNLPLRSLPPSRDGKLRLIEIENFDLTACGGTHVRATGEVGLVKIVRLERQKDQLRVEFCCGQRALGDYRQKNSIVNQLTAELTTGAPEIVPIVKRMQAELKENHRTIKNQQNTLLSFEAERLLQQAKTQGAFKLITRVFTDDTLDATQLRMLANHLTNEAGVVALLGLAGAKSQLLFCRAEDAPGAMNQLLKPALQILGSASGGGSATMAQGGGPTADAERVQQALERAQRLWIGQI